MVSIIKTHNFLSSKYWLFEVCQSIMQIILARYRRRNARICYIEKGIIDVFFLKELKGLMIEGRFISSYLHIFCRVEFISIKCGRNVTVDSYVALVSHLIQNCYWIGQTKDFSKFAQKIANGTRKRRLAIQQYVPLAIRSATCHSLKLQLVLAKKSSE